MISTKGRFYSHWIALTAFLGVLLIGCDHESQMQKTVGELSVKVDYVPAAEDNREIEYFKIVLQHESQQIDLLDFLTEASGMMKEQALYYLSYRLEHDIYLEVNGEKIASTLYHFERSYDLRKERVVNVGFPPLGEEHKQVSLVMDSELLNVGKLKFGL